MRELEVRIVDGDKTTRLAALLVKSGSMARRSFELARSHAGVQVLFTGEREYHVALAAPDPANRAALVAAIGRKVVLEFRGRRPVRQILAAVAGRAPVAAPAPAAPVPAAPPAAALDLTAGIHGAAPLFLLASGELD